MRGVAVALNYCTSSDCGWAAVNTNSSDNGIHADIKWGKQEGRAVLDMAVVDSFSCYEAGGARGEEKTNFFTRHFVWNTKTKTFK